jgi:hypothetical protein
MISSKNADIFRVVKSSKDNESEESELSREENVDDSEEDQELE